MAKGVFVYWSNMKLKNVLIVVENIEEAKKFYHDLFGLETVLDNEENMILTERLVLQEKKIWEEFLGKGTVPESNSCELYFEERDLEAFVRKLERLDVPVRYVSRMTWEMLYAGLYDSPAHCRSPGL